MAQGPFTLAIQRIANALGVLAPAQRAIRFASPLTVIDVPETQAGSTLRGAAGSGEVSGYTEVGLDESLLPGFATSGDPPATVGNFAFDANGRLLAFVTDAEAPAGAVRTVPTRNDGYVAMQQRIPAETVAADDYGPVVYLWIPSNMTVVGAAFHADTDAGVASDTDYAEMRLGMDPFDDPDVFFAHASTSTTYLAQSGIGEWGAGHINFVIDDPTPLLAGEWIAVRSRKFGAGRVLPAGLLVVYGHMNIEA